MKIVIDVSNKDFATIIRYYNARDLYKTFDYGNLISMVVWEKAAQLQKIEEANKKMQNIKNEKK